MTGDVDADGGGRAPRARTVIWAIAAGVALLFVAVIVALVVWLAPERGSEAVAEPPEPTASPTSAAPEPPAEPDAPQARVRISCDELVAPEAVAAAIGAPASAGSSFPVRDVQDALLRQAGMASCRWTAGDRELRAIVALDPTLFDTVLQDEVVSSLDGRRIAEMCSVDDLRSWCHLNLAADDVFVLLNLSGSDADEIRAGLRGLVPGVAAAVSAAPAGPTDWTPPPTSLSAAAVDALDPAVVGDVFGVVDAQRWGGEYGSLAFRAVRETGAIRWTVGDGAGGVVEVFLLPGGSWAIDELREAGYTPMAVDGVARAVLAPTPDPVRGGAVACMDVDRSLVCVTTVTDEPTPFAEGLAAYVALLLAARS